jgi:pyruvate,water dikinase
VGWKAANLAEVTRLGAGDAVPDWFAVSDAAFRQVLAANAPPSVWPRGIDQSTMPVQQAIEEILAHPTLSDAQRACAIRRLWSEVSLPTDLAAEIASAYRQLAGPDDEAYVAIRSSATEEDTEATVRAGEFDTFLFIRGEDAVLEHVKRAWSGLWTERALHNRAVLGLPAWGEGGGVLVQRIVWSRVSGVLQTINTTAGRWREMIINVGLGMGEGVVSGVVGADYIVVSKESDFEASPLRFHYITGDKRQRVVFNRRAGIGTVREDTVSHQRFRPALEYIELLELVQVAARLEAAYRYPLDLEFGFEGPRLRLLQVRPTPGSLAPWRETEERYPLAREAR